MTRRVDCVVTYTNLATGETRCIKDAVRLSTLLCGDILNNISFKKIRNHINTIANMVAISKDNLRFKIDFIMSKEELDLFSEQ